MKLEQNNQLENIYNNSREKLFNEIEKYRPLLKEKLKKIFLEAIKFKNYTGEAKNFLIEDFTYFIEDHRDIFQEFSELNYEEIEQKLKMMNFDEVIEMYVTKIAEVNVDRETRFLELFQGINSKIKEVYFDLDETLVSKIIINNEEQKDFVRPAAEILLNKLKKRGIRIGILTTRSSDYIPTEIKKYVDGEIIGRKENEKYREQCFKKFGFEDTPYDAKECFVKIKAKNQDILVVDDAHYAKEYENCIYVNEEARFFI